MRNTHSTNLLLPPSTTLNIQFLTNVSFTGWNRGWKLSDSMIRKAIRFALLVVMLGSGRVTAQVTEVTEGFYRIVSNQDQTYHLCPAQDPANLSVVYRVNDNLMLTTKKDLPEADYTVWRIEGRFEGHALGLAEGHAKGLEEGQAKGRAEGLKEVAAKMKQMGMPVEAIVQATGLTADELSQL